MGGLRFKVHTQGMAALKARFGRNAGPAEHMVALQVAKDTSTYVPMRTGSLDQRTRVEGNAVIYPGPYARYLHGGILYVSPSTGSSWAKKGERKVATSRALKISRAVHPKAQSDWTGASKKHNLKKWKRVAAKAVKHG